MNIWQNTPDSAALSQQVESELASLRQHLEAFSSRHQEAAERLSIGNGMPADPDMALMLQGTALLCAKLHLRLNDGYSALCEQLLEIMAQDLLVPLPAMCIGRITDYAGSSVVHLGSNTRFQAQIGENTHDFFSTVDVEIPPWNLLSLTVSRGPFPESRTASIPAGSALKLALSSRCKNTPKDNNLSSLLFYLPPYAASANELFDLITSKCLGVLVSSEEDTFSLPPEKVILPAFKDDWSLLPINGLTFSGLNTLHQFLSFPDFFRFIQIDLGEIKNHLVRPTFEVWLLFDDISPTIGRSITPEHMLLGCVPLANIYPSRSGPAPLHHKETEFPIPKSPIYPDSRIFKITEITDISDPDTPKQLPPFLSSPLTESALSWMMVRKPETDCLIFEDTRSQRSRQPSPLLVVHALCYDTTAIELPMGTMLDCYCNQLPGVSATMIGRGYPVRPSPMRKHPPWSQLASLLLNSRTLFVDDHAHTRFSELLALFFSPESGIDKTITTCITELKSRQEVMPVINNNHCYASIGCQFYLRLNKNSIAGLPVSLFVHMIADALDAWRPFGNRSGLSAGFTHESEWRWRLNHE